MPFFSSRREPSPGPREADRAVLAPSKPAPEPVLEPAAKKQGFFHRRRHDSLDGSSSRSSVMSGDHSTTLGRAPSAATTDAGSLGRKRTLHRTFGNGHSDNIDPSIAEARERVLSAEAAEKDADRALEEARLRVREAREHVRRVEEEAKEESRRAMIKHQQALDVSKRGKGLGRELTWLTSDCMIANWSPGHGLK